MTNRAQLHFSQVPSLILLLSLVLFSGCVGATRLPARSRGPGGTQIEPKQIDLAFVQTGTTQRQEVLDKLSMINTGLPVRDYSGDDGQNPNGGTGGWWSLPAREEVRLGPEMQSACGTSKTSCSFSTTTA